MTWFSCYPPQKRTVVVGGVVSIKSNNLGSEFFVVVLLGFCQVRFDGDTAEVGGFQAPGIGQEITAGVKMMKDNQERAGGGGGDSFSRDRYLAKSAHGLSVV